jgi:hypothetical protein
MYFMDDTKLVLFTDAWGISAIPFHFSIMQLDVCDQTNKVRCATRAPSLVLSIWRPCMWTFWCFSVRKWLIFTEHCLCFWSPICICICIWIMIFLYLKCSATLFLDYYYIVTPITDKQHVTPITITCSTMIKTCSTMIKSTNTMINNV